MALRIHCPHCGSRPHTEFTFGGESRRLPTPSDGLEEDYQRVWLPENAAGIQSERWFHAYGCRRWLTVKRDTLTNEIHEVH